MTRIVYLTPKAQATLENGYHSKVLECNERIRNATTDKDREWWYRERHYWIEKLRRVRKGYTFE